MQDRDLPACSRVRTAQGSSSRAASLASSASAGSPPSSQARAPLPSMGQSEQGGQFLVVQVLQPSPRKMSPAPAASEPVNADETASS